jgi:hypothetical protein
MSTYDSPLKNLRIASPCSADWHAMAGDERKRFCGECKLNVYNLSGMTSYDAEHLLRMSEGRICVRYYERRDGTVLTQNCPVGWAHVRQRVSVTVAALFSVLISLFAGLFYSSSFGKRGAVMGGVSIAPVSRPSMGNIAIPAPTPTLTHSREDDMAVMGAVNRAPKQRNGEATRQ